MWQLTSIYSDSHSSGQNSSYDIKFEFFLSRYENLYGFQFSQDACIFTSSFLSSFMVCKLIHTNFSFHKKFELLNPLPESEELVDLSSDRQKFEGP